MLLQWGYTRRPVGDVYLDGVFKAGKCWEIQGNRTKMEAILGFSSEPCLTAGGKNNAITWVNYNDLTVLPHWKSWFRYRGIIPFYGRKIQISEFIIICPDPLVISQFANWKITMLLIGKSTIL